MNLKTIQEYADLCRVSKQVIWKRIHQEEIKVERKRVLGMKSRIAFIDADAYPPEGARKPYRIWKKFVIIN